MTTHDGFERTVAVWLRDDAERPFPDQLDALLARTGTTPQRRWWSSPERWLPMDTTFTGRAAPTFRPIRLLLVVALVAIALVAALAITGSNRTKVPPFGPALTGLVASDDAGDIVVLDPVTKNRTVMVSGPDWDTAPGFSLDGTKFAFGRQTSQGSTPSTVMVANADGTGLRPITSPLDGIDSAAWSGDGSYIAISATDTTTPDPDDNMLVVADVARGTSERLALDLSAWSVRWLPPLGHEIVFQAASPLPSAIWAVRPDGTGLRPLTPRDGNEHSYNDPFVSPDGRLLAWTSWEDTVHVAHVRDLVDGRTWIIPPIEAAFDDRGDPQFSPDGRHLLFHRHQRDGPPPSFDGFNQVVLAPVDGTGQGITLGPRFPDLEESDLAYAFTADGANVLLLDRISDTLWTLPIDGSAGSSEPWPSDWLPAHQRVASPG